MLDNNIQLKQIVAPSLHSSEYGEDIRKQFENIDDNFRMLANRAFVAGKDGSAVLYANVSLYSHDEFTDLGIALLNAISGLNFQGWNDLVTTDQYLADNRPDLLCIKIDSRRIDFYDYIKKNPSITVLYNLIDTEAEDEESNRKYLCSPTVYTFLDSRYSDEEVGGLTNNETLYWGKQDYSCLLSLQYENDEPLFVKANLFPTIYYDKNDYQFKWKLYNQETGIRAQGPQGETGAKTAVQIVQINADSNLGSNTTIKLITKYLEYDGTNYHWVDVVPGDDYIKAGDVCIALGMTQTNPGNSALFSEAFVSQIIEVSGSFYIWVDQTNAINRIIEEDLLYNLLRQVLPSNDPSAGLGGLFIPFTNEVGAGAHAAYNVHDNQTNKDELVIRPINDVESNKGNFANASTAASKMKINYPEINIQGQVGVIGSVGITGSFDSYDGLSDGKNVKVSSNINDGILIRYEDENERSNGMFIDRYGVNISSKTSGASGISIDASAQGQLKLNSVNIKSDKNSTTIKAGSTTGSIILDASNAKETCIKGELNCELKTSTIRGGASGVFISSSRINITGNSSVNITGNSSVNITGNSSVNITGGSINVQLKDTTLSIDERGVTASSKINIDGVLAGETGATNISAPSGYPSLNQNPFTLIKNNIKEAINLNGDNIINLGGTGSTASTNSGHIRVLKLDFRSTSGDATVNLGNTFDGLYTILNNSSAKVTFATGGSGSNTKVFDTKGVYQIFVYTDGSGQHII